MALMLGIAGAWHGPAQQHDAVAAAPRELGPAAEAATAEDAAPGAHGHADAPICVSQQATRGDARVPPGRRFRDCADCPEMIVIPAGQFLMGSPAREPERSDAEGPQLRVSIRAFALGVAPVTFAQWDACVAAGGCVHRPSDEGWGRGTRPVINVSWDDARGYAAWLSSRRPDLVTRGLVYRLPTEAEWEYAARAGTTAPRWWGDAVGRGNANCNGCGSRWDNRMTAPVGSFRANAFGLNDMLGNVSQWVEDCWHDALAGRPADQSAVLTGTCSDRAVRGGSWFESPSAVRSGRRTWTDHALRDSVIGFRVARTLTP